MKCLRCKKEIADDCLFCPLCGKKLTASAKSKTQKRANGTGCISLLSGKRRRPYMAAINKKSIGTFATKKEAVDALRDAEQKDINLYNSTFEDIYKMWYPLYTKNLSQKTIDGIEGSFKKLSVLHNEKFKNLKSSFLQTTLNSLYASNSQNENLGPLSRSSEQKIVYLLNQLYIFAVQNDIVDKNYATYLTVKKPESNDVKIFNKTQIELIKCLAFLPAPVICSQKDNYEQYLIDNRKANDIFAAKVALVLICTGFRINELFTITLDNVSDAAIIGGLKTDAGKNRRLPILQVIKPIIAQWKKENKVYLVETVNHLQMSDNRFRKKLYYPMLESLMIEPKQTTYTDDNGITRNTERIYNPHICRHTFASLADEAGVNHKVLTMVVGHSNDKITEKVYIHKNEENFDKEINKIKI